MKKYLFMTVGTGTDIEKGMLVSIKNHNPDKVIFLASEEAMEKKKTVLEEELKKLSCEYEWVKISTHEHFESCLDEIRKVINKCDLRNCNPAFDITFGSKPMTAALAIVASKVGNFISYVTGGQRDQHGKVISGTERFISFETRGFRVKSAIEEGITLFNRNLFNASKQLLLYHRDLLDERLPLRRYLETLLLLIDLQLAREDFLFEIASEKLQGLLDFLPELSEFLNLAQEILREKIGDFISKFNDVAKNPFSVHRLGELIASAERTASIGRYNDAAARLYRALEFIGQLKLKEHDMIDEDFLPVCRVIDGKCERVEDYKTRPSGLTEIYKCLYFLGYEAASEIINPLTNQPNNILSFRNKTILAHGFKPVRKEDYEEMKRFVMKIAEKFNLPLTPVLRDLNLKIPF